MYHGGWEFFKFQKNAIDGAWPQVVLSLVKESCDALAQCQSQQAQLGS